MLFYLCFALVFVVACNGQSSIEDFTEDPDNRNAICTKKNGYYKVDGSCDAYVQCIEFVATYMSCPDGLHFDLNAKWPSYPCGYPMDVPCIGRGMTQPADPTDDCPHRYGFFPSPAATSNCSQYRICVAGQAFEMHCPSGLAFNPITSRCDWPDQVDSCNVEDYFFGFKCPPVPLNAIGEPMEGVTNHKNEFNCHYFYSCEKGSPRLLSCDPGLAFDPALGRCVDAYLVQCEMSFQDYE